MMGRTIEYYIQDSSPYAPTCDIRAVYATLELATAMAEQIAQKQLASWQADGSEWDNQYSWLMEWQYDEEDREWVYWLARDQFKDPEDNHWARWYTVREIVYISDQDDLLFFMERWGKENWIKAAKEG